MAIETQTPAAREELRRRLNQSYGLVQHIAQSETVTAAQAVAVDAALVQLNAALAGAGAAGGSVIPPSQTIVASGVKRPVGTVTGTGTYGTATVVNGVITGIVLSAS